jgi:hypothetical protein
MYPTDVFFGSRYREVETHADPDDKIIFLQICWDGADMHNMSGKSMWPIFYCIMNLPPSLRHIVHVGMHMAGFDLGSYCSLDIFVDEMIDLWVVGFNVYGVHYRVFVIEALCDSRGREKFMKVQGPPAHVGCNKCHFSGRQFGKTAVYEGVRAYLSVNDSRRRKSVQRNALKQVIYYIINCRKILHLPYSFYL